jgi:hypothetical protein
MKRCLVKVWIPGKQALYVVKAENNMEAMEKALEWFKEHTVQDSKPGEAWAEVVPEIE